MKKTVKVYELYGWTHSVKTIAYDGYMMAVAAVSIKQALFFTHNNKKADNPEYPRGILWEYFREDGLYRLWNGKTGYSLGGVRHGDGIRRIREWMEEQI